MKNTGYFFNNKIVPVELNQDIADVKDGQDGVYYPDTEEETDYDSDDGFIPVEDDDLPQYEIKA